MTSFSNISYNWKSSYKYIWLHCRSVISNPLQLSHLFSFSVKSKITRADHYFLNMTHSLTSSSQPWLGMPCLPTVSYFLVEELHQLLFHCPGTNPLPLKWSLEYLSSLKWINLFVLGKAPNDTSRCFEVMEKQKVSVLTARNEDSLNLSDSPDLQPQRPPSHPSPAHTHGFPRQRWEQIWFLVRFTRRRGNAEPGPGCSHPICLPQEKQEAAFFFQERWWDCLVQNSAGKLSQVSSQASSCCRRSWWEQAEDVASCSQICRNDWKPKGHES